MTGHDLDVSLACLAVLQDSRAAQVDKETAFSRMMSLKNGWWGRRSLYAFSVACAFACARSKLTPHNISVDRLDFEGLADEGLMILFRNAGTIRENPRSWLAGVLKNLVRSEIRDNWQYLTSTEVPDDTLAPEEHVGFDPETSKLSLDERIIDAIRRLSPALRVIAELHYIHQIPRDELAAVVDISEETLRKRLQRAREALQRSLAPALDQERSEELVNA